MLQAVTRRNVRSNIDIPCGIGYADAFFPYPAEEIYNVDITPEKIDELKRYENRIVKIGDELALLKKVNRGDFVYLIRGVDDGRTFIIEATSQYKNVIIRDDKNKILFSNIGGCSKSDCRYYYPEEGNADNTYFRLDRLFTTGEQILKRRSR